MWANAYSGARGLLRRRLRGRRGGVHGLPLLYGQAAFQRSQILSDAIDAGRGPRFAAVRQFQRLAQLPVEQLEIVGSHVGPF